MRQGITVGTKVGYVGLTIDLPWLPRGTEGVVTDIYPGLPFPFICRFNVDDGEDWPMAEQDLEVIE